MAIEEILDLEQLEVNIYRGAVFSPESGFLQRTFGGHILGQSLASAIRTVEPQFGVHSLHGYFLRPGDATKTAVYLVDRPRDGGSFCTRRVNAVQHGEVIFSMGVSFHTQQSGIEHQDEMPLPDDPVLHICALTYMSDLTLLGSAQAIHQEERANLMVASLDHAVWFMRPFRVDEWLLYDQSSPSAGGGRSLTQGKIFNGRGDMVAAVMQEGLTRYKRGYTPPVS